MLQRIDRPSQHSYSLFACVWFRRFEYPGQTVADGDFEYMIGDETRQEFDVEDELGRIPSRLDSSFVPSRSNTLSVPGRSQSYSFLLHPYCHFESENSERIAETTWQR
jgi:hypothetical protein